MFKATMQKEEKGWSLSIYTNDSMVAEDIESNLKEEREAIGGKVLVETKKLTKGSFGYRVKAYVSKLSEGQAYIKTLFKDYGRN